MRMCLYCICAEFYLHWEKKKFHYFQEIHTVLELSIKPSYYYFCFLYCQMLKYCYYNLNVQGAFREHNDVVFPLFVLFL